MRFNVLGHETNVLIKHLAENISFEGEKSLREVTGWVRNRMAFDIVRAKVIAHLKGFQLKE